MSENTTAKSITEAVNERNEAQDEIQLQFLSDMEELLPTYIKDGGSMAELIKLTGMSQPKVYELLKELDLKFPRRGKVHKYNIKEREQIAKRVFKRNENITKVAAQFDLSEQQVRSYGKEFGLYEPKRRQRTTATQERSEASPSTASRSNRRKGKRDRLKVASTARMRERENAEAEADERELAEAV